MDQNRLLNACYSFLVPVARFLLRNGVSFRQFEELARTAFVHVAGEEFGLRGRPTNVSRVSAITGIPRKEISRIRDLMEKYGSTPREQISPLGNILRHWFTDKDFLGPDGQPLPLPTDGEGATFESLTKRCAGDLPFGALKSELLRTGAIVVVENGRLLPKRRQAVPESFDDKLITSMSFNLYGLASTIAFNSDPSRTETGRIERFVQSEHIPLERKDELRDSLRDQIECFALDLDDQFSRTETESSQGMSRVAVGLYYFEEEN